MLELLKCTPAVSRTRHEEAVSLLKSDRIGSEVLFTFMHNILSSIRMPVRIKMIRNPLCSANPIISGLRNRGSFHSTAFMNVTPFLLEEYMMAAWEAVHL